MYAYDWIKWISKKKHLSRRQKSKQTDKEIGHRLVKRPIKEEERWDNLVCCKMFKNSFKKKRRIKNDDQDTYDNYIEVKYC